MQADWQTKEEGKKQSAGNKAGVNYAKGVELLKQNMPYVETVAGDYIITIGFEKAADWYVFSNGRLEGREPDKE